MAFREDNQWPPATVAHLPRPPAHELTLAVQQLTKSLVLGSKSLSRRRTLEAMGLAFECRSANLDE
jgi:hypothetical protein